jgi:hypothetical protein
MRLRCKIVDFNVLIVRHFFEDGSKGVSITKIGLAKKEPGMIDDPSNSLCV